jgi:Zn-dependent M28 family amino/carboxypeptidase
MGRAAIPGNPPADSPALPQRPERWVFFVSHVGEEGGLDGSVRLTDHLNVPRDSIVARRNMDMIGRGDASDVAGYEKGVKLADHPKPDPNGPCVQ